MGFIIFSGFFFEAPKIDVAVILIRVTDMRHICHVSAACSLCHVSRSLQSRKPKKERSEVKRNARCERDPPQNDGPHYLIARAKCERWDTVDTPSFLFANKAHDVCGARLRFPRFTTFVVFVPILLAGVSVRTTRHGGGLVRSVTE